MTVNQPLCIKFISEANNHYIYDTESNEILQVSHLMYSMVDNYAELKSFDCESYLDHSNSACCPSEEVLKTLKVLWKCGVLKPHIPLQTSKIKGIGLPHSRYSLEYFVAEYSRMLTLELTQKCNLNCIYCCYGKYYSSHRSHGKETISCDVAEKAIRDHLDAKHSGKTITFYGGEPLLEFGLLRHLIEYAKNYCNEIGIEEPSFSFTTNGTLLNEDIIHFIVKHNISVFISLDGDCKSHDSNRIFLDNRTGSFHVVFKNIKLFIELYPSYSRRGIALTLTACTDIRKTNQLLREISAYFPVIFASAVSDNHVLGVQSIMEGCEVSKCSGLSSQAKVPPVCPDFLNWTPERLRNYNNCWSEFYATLLLSHEQAQSEWPLLFEIFVSRYRKIHQRDIFRLPCMRIPCDCIPGAVRTYCTTQGYYFPCEKVENTSLLCIGDVWSGIDSEKVEGLINSMSELVDCNNCKAKRLCSICPNDISERNFSFGSHMQNHCQSIVSDVERVLREYMGLIEKKPDLFESIQWGTVCDDWLREVYFIINDNKEICKKCANYTNV